MIDCIIGEFIIDRIMSGLFIICCCIFCIFPANPWPAAAGDPCPALVGDPP